MEQRALSEIGFIRKTFGFKGEVILAVNGGNAEDFLKGDYLFLDMDGSIVPFYVEAFSAQGTEAVIRFEDVNAHETAVTLVSKKVLLPEDELPEGFSREDGLTAIIGFTIIDRKMGLLGAVKDITETPGQLIVLFEYRGAEIMLPANDQTLLKVLKRKREIHVNIPDGLIEIYTGGKKQ